MAFKYTSEPITIRARVVQSVLNGFEQEVINLNLDTLSREILVILRADVDTWNPDSVPGSDVSITASLANASQTTTINIDDPDTIAVAQKATISDGVSSVAYANQEPTAMIASEDPLYIVATNHLYFGMDSTNCTNTKAAYITLQCRRAKADADTYAALLTSQLS